MRTGAPWLRLGAVLSAGAYAVHQVRYLLVFGADAGRQLDAQGHGYLVGVVPLIAMVLGFAVAQVLWRALTCRGRAWQPRRVSVAVAFAVAMLVIFSAQELLEGQLAGGHASGLSALVSSGGWIAAPLALVFGWLGSLLIVVASQAEKTVLLRDVLQSVRPRAAVDLTVRLQMDWCDRGLTLACHLAGRGPPLLSR